MRGVSGSADLRRILALPVRTWAQGEGEGWARRWTEALVLPPRSDCEVFVRKGGYCPCGGSGRMELRPIQGMALTDAARCRGAALPIRVGGGKTLVSLLAPWAVPSKRPLLLLPAALREKTRRDMEALSRHWRLPPFIRIESYQTLSALSGAYKGSAEDEQAGFLDHYLPDLVICDEAHYLRNLGAACTSRLRRYINDHSPACVFMSGTFVDGSIRDFAHLFYWALGEASPVPKQYNAIEEWSRALDPLVPDHRRLAPGHLDALRASPSEPLSAAYRRRLVGTAGVVATQEAPLPIALTIRSHAMPLDPALSGAYTKLRREWELPDGHALEDGLRVWTAARELSCGFFSRWNPRPPEPWLDARRAWAGAAREIVSNNRRGIDTELQARNAVDAGEYPQYSEALRIWREIEPTFEPNTETVWLSTAPLAWLHDLVREVQARGPRPSPPLVWVERPCVGEALRERYGIPYYGAEGIDAMTGRFVEDADPSDGPISLSIHANREGRNLQHRWSRNILLDIRKKPSIYEQALGRTHRDGQPEPEVTLDLVFGCIEDVSAWHTAREAAEWVDTVSGQAQKIVHADCSGVESLWSAMLRPGPQWNKEKPS